MIRFKKIIARAVIILVAYSPFGNASEMALPGIPPEGNPNFMNDVQVSLFQLGSNYLFAATNDGATITFNDSSKNISLPVGESDFLLTAQFESDGSFKTGTLTIEGSLPFSVIDPNPKLSGLSITGDLLTARLTGFAFDEDTLGFSTELLSGFGTIFGTKESVYLSAAGLGSALGFLNKSLIATTSPLSASAITTVPIPGAGWLIGSALGLFTLVRRNRQNLESVC